jgi:hypothetical protein
MFTFHAAPPATDVPAPTAAEIRAALMAHPGQWAIVYRADRLVRAESHAAKISTGGVTAVVRKIGAECAVWASYSTPVNFL